MGNCIMLNIILEKLTNNLITGLNALQEGFLIGVLNRAIEKQQNLQIVRNIVEDKYTKVSEIVYQSDDCIIYKTYQNTTDDWSVKYPYRFVYLKDDKWIKSNEIFDTFDNAYLAYLGNKHLGNNNEFSFFANRMLGVKD